MKVIVATCAALMIVALAAMGAHVAVAQRQKTEYYLPSDKAEFMMRMKWLCAEYGRWVDWAHQHGVETSPKMDQRCALD